jgi:anaerobic ribonucleoside-triphosphate reductase activating protein
MKAKIAGIQDCTLSDSDGVGMLIFFQGCIHNCKRCQNLEQQIIYKDDTLDMDLSIILERIKKYRPMLDTIVLSGGDPYIQKEAVQFIGNVSNKLGLKVWMYTGYLFKDIDEDTKKYLDVIIDGKFDINKKGIPKHGYGGSINQKMFKKVNNVWKEIKG